jgi:prepilin-type N-terminal cleavage/methylation domain-containing protein
VVKKHAFTLIELVFAIVLIAIAVLSLPVMNQIIAKNTDQGILQEAIFAAATEINEATTAYWDEHSMDPNTSLARVIDTGTCENNASSSRFRLMKGHIAQKLHRRCVDNNETNISNGSDDKNITALDDKEHSSRDAFNNEDATSQGYKDTYQTTLVVDQNVSFGGHNEESMKSIDINVTKSDGTLICNLKSYSANIGEVDFYKKEY